MAGFKKGLLDLKRALNGTPNHLSLLKRIPCGPPGVFVKTDIIM